MTLLYHTYERDPNGSLHCAATGQSLIAIETTADRPRFAYRDSEVEYQIAVQLLNVTSRHKCVALLDWNECTAPVTESYGTWRRLTWFLLDAIAAWTIQARKPQQRVLVFGGWLNGLWLEEAGFEMSWMDGSTPDSLLDCVEPYALFPLDAVAPTWRFERGLDGARVGRIATIEDGSDYARANLAVPVQDQLAEVPRFLGSDGTTFFFHQVVAHVGPDFAPGMDYGIVSKDFGFYFRSQHGFLVGEPFRMSHRAEPPQLALEEPIPAYLQRHNHCGYRSWRVHPTLREAQYFAGTEAYALTFDQPSATMPEMQAIETPLDMRFGFYLGQISNPPMSVGMPSCRLKSWPRYWIKVDELTAKPPGTLLGTPEAESWNRWIEMQDRRLREEDF